jgi:hypothetical protein
MINMDYGRPLERPVVPEAHPRSVVAGTVSRKTVEEAALEYVQRSKHKSRKTYFGYRAAVNLFVASCRKTYFDESAATTGSTSFTTCGLGPRKRSPWCPHSASSSPD